MKKIRTGIYGGSFNPRHNGHLAIARQMTTLTNIDEVWLMVSPQNPLKRSDDLLDDNLRLAMCRKAVENINDVRVSDYEFHLPRPSYMWHTLHSLSNDYPNREFVLLIGADNWTVFDHWYKAKEIIDNYNIYIYPRRGCSINPATLPSTVHIVDTGLYDVSSTQIRKMVKQGESPDTLIPECISKEVNLYYR